jgi:hypothetical protein
MFGFARRLLLAKGNPAFETGKYKHNRKAVQRNSGGRNFAPRAGEFKRLDPLSTWTEAARRAAA